VTVRHVVVWRLKAEDAAVRAEHAAEVARRLGALDGVVPSIRALSVGPNVAYPEANADVALVADFDDVVGLEAYQTHPAHVEAAAYVREVVASRASVDFEV